jgi:hypothetical protein
MGAAGNATPPVSGIIRWRVGFSLRFSKDLERDESLSSTDAPVP